MATAVHKKQSESKYVSCFADSRPDVDITFRDVLLTRPTDHYLVGIDNFSMTNTSLSMIEPKTGHLKPFIRILKRVVSSTDPVPTTEDDLNNAIQAGGTADGIFPVADLIIGGTYDFSIDSTEIILNVQQLMHRLNTLAGDVSTYMNESVNGHGTDQAGADFEFGGYEAADDENFTHLSFEVGPDGRLTIKGSAAFWSCFVIEIPAVQDQFGLFGDRHAGDDVEFTRSRRYLSLDPITGDPTFSKYMININKRKKPVAGQSAVQLAAYNAVTVGGSTPEMYSNDVTDAEGQANTFNSHDGGLAYYMSQWTSKVSIFSSLERRVALEIGCSLPIKNSPMVDHQKESPDFVLGRWIWRVDPRVESNTGGGQQRYSGQMPACTEYQGSMDRICYHELQPQSKIQTLRIKLFARLRSFDETTETYTMRVIDLPTHKTDWWHTRVHFMSKD